MDMRSQWCRFQAAFVLPALMLFCWATLPASAQVQIPPSAFAEETEIETFIDKGKDLEQQGRWGEAYQYYLRDGRQFQDNVQVKNRKAMARIHYDLNRRYADSSFVQAVTNGNHQVSLNVLHEVLLKIDTYHVDQPNWYVMVRHGMSSVEVALLQHEAFQNHFLNNVSPAAIQNAIGRMHEKAKSSPLNNRQQAYQVASAIAAQMEADLNIPSAAIIYEFVCGAIVALDPYSGFLTANQYGETMSQIEGNFVGLGVELKTTDQHLEIVAVIPNGPASQQSIRKGDKIVSVANKPVTEIGGEKAADMLRGEQGSQILIGLEDPEGQMRNVTITRQHVEIPSVQSVAIIDTENATGYLKLTSFQKTTTKDLDLALWQLHRQGMKRLIVDVRGNPGGLLDSSVEVSNRFIQKGRIVLTRGRKSRRKLGSSRRIQWHLACPLGSAG